MIPIELISLVINTAQSALASEWSVNLKARLDQVIENNFQDQTQVGLIVGIVHGNETYLWGYGTSVLGQSKQPDGNTFFEIGSVTKTYTATLLALEVGRGRIALTDTVQMLWPELSGTDAGKITLEQLATHSSGLPRMPTNFAPSDPSNPYRDYDAALLLAFLKEFRQARPGPYAYDYSNVGFGLLGYLLAEKLNGQSFENYVASQLLAPLGMSDTFVKLSSEHLTRTAQGYGNFFDTIPLWDLNALEGAGVLKSTAHDFLKYLKFNMESDTLTELGRASLLAQTPRALGRSKDVQMGLGWMTTKFGEHDVLAHSGATGGYRSDLMFDRSKHLGVVILSNTDVAPTCLLSVVFDKPCSMTPWAPLEIRRQTLRVGQYFSPAIGMQAEVFIENGFLGILPEGQPKLRLWPLSDDRFSIPSAGAEIHFHSSGSFSLHQGGQEYLFLKKSEP